MYVHCIIVFKCNQILCCFKLSKWGIWKWGISRKWRGKWIKKRALRCQMSHLDWGAVGGCFERAVSMAWSSLVHKPDSWESLDGGRGIFCRQPEPLPDMRANIAVFSEGWCAGRMRFKWPAQVFFRFHFLKTASVGDTSRNSVPQLWEKSTHILRLILPKSHNNCHGICCMKCSFIHSCNILCIYTTQSPACFGNQACIEKRVPDISIL